MTPSADIRSGIDARLADVFDQIAGRLRRGEAVCLETCVREHPECADQIRELFPALELMADLSVVRGDSSVSAVTGPSGEAASVSPVTGVLGDFRILREIGRGGMGIVYEAEQISLGRRMALKVLPFAGVLDERQLARFRNEARAAASLEHSNIVRVHSVGCERGVHYYAMQYVEGKTLAEVIAEMRQDRPARSEPRSQPLNRGSMSPIGPMGPIEEPILNPAPPTPNPEPSPADTNPEPQAQVSTEKTPRAPDFFRSVAELGIQAAEGLEIAHQLGVVHRDIKPSNLLVDHGGHLWITDFGLAQVQTDVNITMTGDVVGTLRYMSPEQAQGNRRILDHHTDVYSLGVTLYELLTLAPPFAAHDRHELIHQIIDGEPRPPRQTNAAIPRDLETIVLKAMALAPEARYATAREMADDLRRFLEDKPIRARRPSPAERAAKWTRRHRPLVWSAAAALLAVLAMLLASTILVLGAYQREQAGRDIADVNAAAAQKNYETAREAVRQMLTRVANEELAAIPEMKEVRIRLLEDAAAFYTKLIELNPRDPRAYYERGGVYWALRHEDKVRPDYEKAVELDGENAEYHRALGTFFCRGTDYVWRDSERALFHIKRAIELAPKDPPQYELLGSVYLTLGKVEEARAAYRHGAALVPGTGLEQLFLSFECAANDDHEGRLRHLKKGAELEPASPAHPFWQAAVYQKHGRYEEAIGAATKAIALAKKQPAIFDALVSEIHGMRAAAYWALKMDREALADYDTSIRLAPLYSFTYKRRARVHFHLKNYDKALADIAKAVELRPYDWSNITWIKPDEVAQCPDESFRKGILRLADKVVELNHGASRAQVKRIDVYAAMGREKEAVGELEGAISKQRELVKKSPGVAAHRQRLAELQSTLAQVHVSRGYWFWLHEHKPDEAAPRFSKAITIFTELAAQLPREPCYQMDLAVAYIARGKATGKKSPEDSMRDLAEAVAISRKLAAGDPDTRASHFREWRPAHLLARAMSWRARRLVEDGKLDEAVADCTEAIGSDPTYSEAYRHRAEAYRKKGDVEKAIADYREAIRLNPKDAEAQTALSKLLEQTKEKQEPESERKPEPSKEQPG